MSDYAAVEQPHKRSFVGWRLLNIVFAKRWQIMPLLRTTIKEALSADDFWISSLLINDGGCAAVEQLQTQLCRPATVAYGDWVQVPGELGWGNSSGALKNSFTYSYVYRTFFNVRFKTFPGFSLQLILAFLWRKIWRIFQRDALPSYSLHFYFHFDYHDTVLFIDLEKLCW